MGRRERKLDPEANPVERFAHELRELRREAGSPSYRELAHTAHFSASALSTAANGRALPSLAVLEAYVRACGGDEDEWQQRWRSVSRQTPDTAQCPGDGAPAAAADSPAVPAVAAPATANAPSAPSADAGERPVPGLTGSRLRRRVLIGVPIALLAAAAASVVATMGPGKDRPAAASVATTAADSFAPGTACGAKDGQLAPLPPSAQETDGPADPSGQITFATANDTHRWGNWWHPEQLRGSVTTDHPYLGRPALRLEVTSGYTAVGSIRMQGLDAGDTVTVHLWYDGQGEAAICPFIQQSTTGFIYWPRVHELVLRAGSVPGWRTYQWRIPDMQPEGTGFQVDNTGVADVVLYLGAVTW